MKYLLCLISLIAGVLIGGFFYPGDSTSTESRVRFDDTNIGIANAIMTKALWSIRSDDVTKAIETLETAIDLNIITAWQHFDPTAAMTNSFRETKRYREEFPGTSDDFLQEDSELFRRRGEANRILEKF